MMGPLTVTGFLEMAEDPAGREVLRECGYPIPPETLGSLMPKMPEATKFDAGKPRVELIPPVPYLAVGSVFGFGAEKYGVGNYLIDGGLDPKRLLGAALRHQADYSAGQEVDPESGLPHLAHAIASLLMIMDIELHS